MLKLSSIARVSCISLGLAGAMLMPLAPGVLRPALAQNSAADADFVRSLGQKLVAVVNSSAPAAEKKAQIQPVLDHDVDVDSIGRFCLGRFWRTATPAQQQEYLTLFHQVLTNTIDGKLGDYRGVGIAIGQATVQDNKSFVATTITRPGQPTANVQWVVSRAGGAPRIVDVVAEGISLSLTQRSDYASFLAHKNNDVGALIEALKHQVARQS